MVEDVALTPVNVGLFGAIGIMFSTNSVAELVEQFFSLLS